MAETKKITAKAGQTTEKKISPARNANSKAIAGGKKYIESVGRRKTSTCRIRIVEGGRGHIIINGKDVKDYFKTDELIRIVNDPVTKTKITEKFDISALVKGGGIHSQAEAVRHGISRALVEFDQELRVKLKKMEFLKRDPRMKERRKFGLKKARKAPQWSKR
ncbi:MAG: 30S ribosomal protein S9 [Candidatus Paceibacterota bacterium]|jgi:small subunit ribosomal protein S9